MAIEIPKDFDYRKEHLDPAETFVRDCLKLNIINWEKFRLTIHTGTDSKLKCGESTHLQEWLKGLISLIRKRCKKIAHKTQSNFNIRHLCERPLQHK